MAKLNGVKTVDMVNGEITKVAYEGAEYAKVESDALIGDLALCVNETPFFTVGEFYLAWDLYETGEPRMKDDADDNYRMRTGCYELFRNISAQSKPTLEQRVETIEQAQAQLESDVAALKGEKKSEETIEFEGATYRKVDREAREGDVVIFRKNESVSVDNDTPYKVGQADYGGGKSGLGVLGKYRVYKAGYRRTRETVDVYEPIEQAKYVPQEGDIVVIVKSEHGSRNSVGDIGKVSDVSPISFAVDVPQKPDARNVNGNKHDAYEVRKATPAEVEKYEQAVKDANKPKLKAGDFVKWTDGSQSLPNGEIFEVFEDVEGLHVIDDDGDKRWSALKNPLFKYEILSAEEAKWAKIGRKPNELRKGDIVRITDTCGAPLRDGNLIEVISDSTEMSAIVKGGWVVCSKLIAPVNSSF